MRLIRILIADDHTLVRQGLRQLCEGLGGFAVVTEAASGAQAVTLARTTEPDVILMDIVMPDVDGVAAIRQIMRETPAARVLSEFHLANVGRYEAMANANLSVPRHSADTLRYSAMASRYIDAQESLSRAERAGAVRWENLAASFQGSQHVARQFRVVRLRA